MAAPINSKSLVDRDWHTVPVEAKCLMRKTRLQTGYGPALQLGHLPYPPCLCFSTLKENGNKHNSHLLWIYMGISWMSIKWAHLRGCIISIKTKILCGLKSNRHLNHYKKRIVFSPHYHPLLLPLNSHLCVSQQQRLMSSTSQVLTSEQDFMWALTHSC